MIIILVHDKAMPALSLRREIREEMISKSVCSSDDGVEGGQARFLRTIIDAGKFVTNQI
jgi:hypothetical protein